MAPQWLGGCHLRHCYFQPTFHKHTGRLCAGVQIHTDHHFYRHQQFKPYRIAALLLKAIRLVYPDYSLWRDFVYEYESDRVAIDLISGGPFLRQWVDDRGTTPQDFEVRLISDESFWYEQRRPFLLY